MPFSNPQFDHYRLVLVCPSTRRILVEGRGKSKALPRVSIPRWTRAAEKLTELIECRWGMKAIVLDFLGDRPGHGSIVIVELIDDAACPEGYRWGQVTGLPLHEIGHQERAIVRKLLKHGDTGRGSFSRLGWVDEALDWVSVTAAVDRARLSKNAKQLNGFANSTLIRIERSRNKSYWLKATDRSTTREKNVTLALSSLFPKYLPRVLGSHDQWNAWLMEDAGISLGEYEALDSEVVCQVVRSLAEFQRASVNHVDTLFSAGCHDHRMPALRAGIPELVPYLERAMRAPDRSAGLPVRSRRIRELAKLIEEASYKMEEIGVPDAIMHCDINLTNIFKGKSGCRFSDWAQASIGNPFVTFESFRIQLAQRQDTRDSIPQLGKVYRDVWRFALSDTQLDCAFSLLPLIAPAAHLCCRRDWLTSEHRHTAESHSYARILTRQLDRAAQRIELQEPACA